MPIHPNQNGFQMGKLNSTVSVTI